MPMVRAMRLLNAIEAGALDGAGLQSLLAADAGRVSELHVLCAMPGQVARMAASPVTMNALASSALARGVIGTTSASPAFAIMSGHDMAAAKLIAGAAGLVPADYTGTAAIASSSTAMTAIAASEPSLLAAIASAPALQAIDGNATARAKVYGAVVGGGYFGCVHAVGGARYAVIQAPKASGEIAGVQWKTTTDASSNTSDNAFGLINANAQNNAQHPLFQWARGLTIGGFSDWAPPAYNVIQALAAKMRRAAAENTLFKVGGAQVYEDSRYWSATQHPSSAYDAWYVDFSSGSANAYGKSLSYRARAVRMIKL